MKLIHTEEHKFLEYFFSFGGIAYEEYYFDKIKKNRKREICSVTVKRLSGNERHEFDYYEIVNAIGQFDYTNGLTLQECQGLKLKALKKLLQENRIIYTPQEYE